MVPQKELLMIPLVTPMAEVKDSMILEMKTQER